MYGNFYTDSRAQTQIFYGKSCAIYTSKTRISRGSDMINVSLTHTLFDIKMSRNYENQKPSHKRCFVPICQIKGHPGHINRQNTS